MRQQNLLSHREIIRLVIPTIAAVSLFVFSIFLVLLPQVEENMFEDRKKTSKALVQSAWHVLQRLDEEVNTGVYDLKDAQKLASLLLREIRYGDENKNYLWINDVNKTIIMHPYRTDFEGQDMSDFVDTAGTKVFNEIVKIVKDQRQGFVDYRWQWMDDQNRIVPKLSFVKEFRPWGWIIGTGIYLEDAKIEIASITKRIVTTSAIILIFVSLLAYYQIHQNMAAMRLRNKAEAELIEHKNQLEIKVKQRTAELTDLNSALIDSEEKYHNLSDASFEGIVITEKGRILEANRAMSEIFGYSVSELTSMTATSLTASDMREFVRDKLSTGYEKLYESECLRKDGSEFPVEVQAKMFMYKNREVRVTAIRDITYRKQAEEEIKTLRGFLPICANCKKIRDDRGYWNQIESYIEKHSDAQFSHGICQDCAEELYGDQDWYQKRKKEGKL